VFGVYERPIFASLNPFAATTDRRAVCGKTALTVRREGSLAQPDFPTPIGRQVATGKGRIVAIRCQAVVGRARRASTVWRQVATGEGWLRCVYTSHEFTYHEFGGLGIC
jgi:hypothetical protein